MSTHINFTGIFYSLSIFYLNSSHYTLSLSIIILFLYIILLTSKGSNPILVFGGNNLLYFFNNSFSSFV